MLLDFVVVVGRAFRGGAGNTFPVSRCPLVTDAGIFYFSCFWVVSPDRRSVFASALRLPVSLVKSSNSSGSWLRFILIVSFITFSRSQFILLGWSPDILGLLPVWRGGVSLCLYNSMGRPICQAPNLIIFLFSFSFLPRIVARAQRPGFFCAFWPFFAYI